MGQSAQGKNGSKTGVWALPEVPASNRRRDVQGPCGGNEARDGCPGPYGYHGGED